MKGCDIIKIIFLDIDGVLNGYNWFTYFVYGLCDKLHLRSFIRKHYDIFGVRTYCVYLLSRIVKKTGAKVVLSSSWRHGWYVPYDECIDNMKCLKDKFKRFNIEVVGITPRCMTKESYSHRETEIKQWLSTTNLSIDKFIVFDDEKFDLQGFIGNELILTSTDGNIRGHWKENTGLKLKHVRKAIKLLNQ